MRLPLALSLLLACTALHCSLEPAAGDIGIQSPAAGGWAGIYAMPTAVPEAAPGWHAFYGYPSATQWTHVTVDGSAAAYVHNGSSWQSLGTITGGFHAPAAQWVRPGGVLWVALYPLGGAPLGLDVSVADCAVDVALAPAGVGSEQKATPLAVIVDDTCGRPHLDGLNLSLLVDEQPVELPAAPRWTALGDGDTGLVVGELPLRLADGQRTLSVELADADHRWTASEELAVPRAVPHAVFDAFFSDIGDGGLIHAQRPTPGAVVRMAIERRTAGQVAVWLADVDSVTARPVEAWLEPLEFEGTDAVAFALPEDERAGMKRVAVQLGDEILAWRDLEVADPAQLGARDAVGEFAAELSFELAGAFGLAPGELAVHVPFAPLPYGAELFDAKSDRRVAIVNSQTRWLAYLEAEGKPAAVLSIDARSFAWQLLVGEGTVRVRLGGNDLPLAGLYSADMFAHRFWQTFGPGTASAATGPRHLALPWSELIVNLALDPGYFFQAAPPPACTADMAETLAFNYGALPGRQNPRALPDGTRIATYGNLKFRRVNVYWTRLANSLWTAADIAAEHQRVRTWYLQYCIDITFIEFAFPTDRTTTKLVNAYNQWKPNVDMAAGNPRYDLTFSTQTKNEGVAFTESFETQLRKEMETARAGRPAAPKGSLMVYYLNRNAIKPGSSTSAEASANVVGRNSIIMHGADHDDPYILAHELIHAFGRPVTRKGGKLILQANHLPGKGQFTWNHSANPHCMSNITRRTLAQAAGLTAARMLDAAEYYYITQAGQVR